jgi:rhodanese-related sulfurtransferase
MFPKITPEKIPGLIAVVAVICLAAVTLVIGQTGINEAPLDARSVHVHPGELLNLLHSPEIVMLDVRSEESFDNFHIVNAQNVPVDEIVDAVLAMELDEEEVSIVVMSNDETAAAEAWRVLAAEDITNVFILEGGVNNWLNIFTDEEMKALYIVDGRKNEECGYVFGTDLRAAAAKNLVANPNPEAFTISYIAKIGAEPVAAEPASGGGCGG